MKVCLKFTYVVTNLICRNEIHREIMRTLYTAKSRGVAVWLSPMFRQNRMVAASRVEISIPCSWIFRPLKITLPQCHETSGTNHPVKWHHITEEERPQLTGCRSLTTLQSCKFLLLVDSDKYYDPVYLTKRQKSLGIGAVAGRCRLASTALF
jgi:hypothetical protein